MDTFDTRVGADDPLAAEVVAVILPEVDDGTATVVLRDRSGRFATRSATTREVQDDRRLARGCVRRSKPIVDPSTREVLGFELERVPPRSAVA